jgi:signal transduction histidine kinase
MSRSKINSLIEAMSPNARTEVAALLRLLTHDLNTPIATFSMDLYSARMLLEDLRAASLESPRPDTAKALLQLEGICTNLEHASSKLAEYVSFLVGVRDKAAATTPEISEE